MVSRDAWPHGGEKTKEALLAEMKLNSKAQAAQHWDCCSGVIGQRCPTLSPLLPKEPFMLMQQPFVARGAGSARMGMTTAMRATQIQAAKAAAPIRLITLYSTSNAHSGNGLLAAFRAVQQTRVCDGLMK